MNVPQLHDLLRFLENLDRELGLQQKLETILSNLTNLTSQPAQPTYQSALAQALESFSHDTEKLRLRITPAQMALISETGGARFFDAGMAAEIMASIANNAMTPSVARDMVQAMVTDRGAYLGV